MIAKIYLNKRGSYSFANIIKVEEGYKGSFIKEVPDSSKIRKYINSSVVSFDNKPLVYRREVNSNHTFSFEDLVDKNNNNSFLDKGIINTFTP
tara:strand:+ start:4287 stop:4565 length:279 start_codon:yes stop_codon:yes gene_type:complete